jgi:hypothetical protein
VNQSSIPLTLSDLLHYGHQRQLSGNGYVRLGSISAGQRKKVDGCSLPRSGLFTDKASIATATGTMNIFTAPVEDVVEGSADEDRIMLKLSVRECLAASK